MVVDRESSAECRVSYQGITVDCYHQHGETIIGHQVSTCLRLVANVGEDGSGRNIECIEQSLLGP